MATIRLTKEFSFEAAHALDGYDGPCREIHGHSYRLFVTVKGHPSEDSRDPKYGMVMDFGILKRIVQEEVVSTFDHALVLRDSEEGRALRGQLAAMQQTIAQNEAQMQAQRMEYAVRDLVRGSGARNADIVYRMLDTSKIAEHDGKYIGVDEQIEALKKSDPYLFGIETPPRAGADPTREPTGSPSVNAQINQAIRQAAGY